MALQNIDANITLDLYNHDTTPSTVKAIQLDSQTRYIAAMLQSMGAEYGLDSNATVQLIVIRPDKVGVQITGTTFTYGDEGAQYDVDSGATVQLIVIRPDKVGVQITGTTFTYGDEGAQFLGPYA